MMLGFLKTIKMHQICLLLKQKPNLRMTTGQCAFFHATKARKQEMDISDIEKVQKRTSKDLSLTQQNQATPPPTIQENTKKPKFDFKVPPGQFVEVDGMNIHYEKLGTGSEVLFMMTPGMGSTRVDYHYHLEGLDRNKFTLIAWDAPGYGFSRPPDREFPLDMLNKDAHLAHKFLKKVGVEKTNVMGFCNGAMTAMILAADRPEVVKKLVLIEGYSYYTDPHLLYYEPLRELKNWHPTEGQRSVDVYGEEYFVKKTNELFDYGYRIRDEKGRGFCMEKLGYIRCPTLLLHSKKSKDVAQEHPFFMVNAIRDSRLILLESGGHFFLKQKPQLVNKIVTDFIFEKNEEGGGDYGE